MNASSHHLHYITNTTHITVTWMLTVPTPRDRSTVPVIRDIQETESRVLVSEIDKVVQFFMVL